jgi:hypothetical protein
MALAVNLPDHIAMEAWVAVRATVKYSVGSDGTWSQQMLVDPMHPTESSKEICDRVPLTNKQIKRLRIHPLRQPKPHSRAHWLAVASGLEATSSSSSSSSSGCPRPAPTEPTLVGWLTDGDFIPVHEQQEPMTSLVSCTQKQCVYTRSELLRERILHHLSDEQTQHSLAAAAGQPNQVAQPGGLLDSRV